MGNFGKIRGHQIKDESVESADIASGSIKAGELSTEAISGQVFVTNLDPFNDRMLIFSAASNSLVQLAPYSMARITPSPYFFVDDTGVSIFKDQVSSSGSFAFSNPPTLNRFQGVDTFFYVSGSISSKDTATTGSAVFGGDVVLSGTLYAGQGTGASAPNLVLDGIQPGLHFKEFGSDRAEIIINDSDNLLITNQATNKYVVFKTNDQGNIREGLRIGGPVPEVVVNEGSNSLVDFRVESDNNTHMLFVDGGNDKVGIGTSSPSAQLHLSNSATDDLLYLETTENSSSASPVFKLKRNSSSPDDADYLGQIKFAGVNDNGNEVNYTKITGKIDDASANTEDGILEFANIKAGSQTITARLRSDSLQLLNSTNLTVDGNVGIGNTSPDDELDVTGNVRISNYIRLNCQNTVDPTGTPPLLNHAHIYSKLTNGVAEIFVQDSSSNVTQISPHNSEGEWQYFSRNTRTGKVVRINMEKMIRRLEEITGESFMEEWYE